MALTLRCLFVTVSELWPSLIGSIKTPGALLKTNRRGMRARDEGKEREDGRRVGGGVTVVSLCSPAGGQMSPLGSSQWTDCASACCKSASVWRGIRQGGRKNVIDGVWLTVCPSVCLPVSHSLRMKLKKLNQWRLFHKNYSVTSAARWRWWMRSFSKTNKFPSMHQIHHLSLYLTFLWLLRRFQQSAVQSTKFNNSVLETYWKLIWWHANTLETARTFIFWSIFLQFWLFQVMRSTHLSYTWHYGLLQLLNSPTSCFSYCTFPTFLATLRDRANENSSSK